MIGTRLAHFDIIRHLGKGGMGEVYQAVDSDLGRSVAIKLLPEIFTGDSARVSRFQQEARVLALLNHPNIAGIHGIEAFGKRKFLVLEFVGGETLAERINRGPIPLGEALVIAKGISEGLEVSHDKGIIHRDLKPANIKITPEGVVKILDFGLAKTYEAGTTNAALSDLPTISMAVTQAGMIVGTAAYMAPEQAKAKSADSRADIWAFGCVLYEMLTGKKVFGGDTLTDILAAVIHLEPDWSCLPAATPPSVRDLLRRCLQKDARRRLQSMGDARIALDEILSGDAPSGATPQKTQRWKVRMALGVGGIVIAVAAGLVTWNLKSSPALHRHVNKMTISLPPGQRLAGLRTAAPMLAISPHEKYVAYVATAQGEDARQIYLYSMESEETTSVAGSVGAHTPFFSPDEQWLGFYNGQDKLMKIQVRGGVAESLTDIVNPFGASWASERKIVFGSFGAVLQEVPDDGGDSHPLTRLKPGETMHQWPTFLPGDKAVLFNVLSDTSTIAVQSLGTDEHRILLQGQGITMPQYSPSGHLVYVQAGSLMAVSFDSETLKVGKIPTNVLPGVLQSQGVAQYNVSSEGSLAYVPGMFESRGSTLVKVSRIGAIEQTFGASPRYYYQPRLSPDGRRVAMDVLDGIPRLFEVWLYNLGNDEPIPFTYKTEGDNRHPFWLGLKRIVFQSNREGTRQVFSQLAEGGGLERLTNFPPPPSANIDIYSFALSSCRDELLTVARLVPNAEAWVLHLGEASGRKIEQLDFPMSADGALQLSPDCHWLAYISNESGRREVWVRSFPGLESRRQISTGGGNEPVWNPDPRKRELFYRNGGDMLAVNISDQGFTERKPEKLFSGPYATTQSAYSRPNYDVFPNGSFLMLKPVEQEPTITQIKVVLGWSEQLKRLVPTGTR